MAVLGLIASGAVRFGTAVVSYMPSHASRATSIGVFAPLSRTSGRHGRRIAVNFPRRRNMPVSRFATGAIVWVASLMCFSLTVRAQGKLGSLTGVVTDPAGAVVPNARITLSGPDGFSKEAASRLRRSGRRSLSTTTGHNLTWPPPVT
jgi:hypothetical protein